MGLRRCCCCGCGCACSCGSATSRAVLRLHRASEDEEPTTAAAALEGAIMQCNDECSSDAGSGRVRLPDEEAEELAPEDADEEDVEEVPLLSAACGGAISMRHDAAADALPSRAAGDVDVLVPSSAVRRKNECCSA